ncbi:MarR family transcriptional regulator [Streptomyces scopuliridis]|uniref:MarR family transcriptional regulator n=1 Tax=Streptomyces scopuliridis TaxID=452529 RepID=A0ACD4ZD57_9ACTN|nr:MarR family transcriptional regulator [Streptomyces scopuliridis]WSB31833.1 MarR family transcriptional regulator [Streptomyces scopuliridis]WSB96090.1 MarR family transcriptional regulator [Streptomyces scopuliridis]WSC10204.1 MarR family transcriptional regulator [Streptomyces scopuliridis]
MSKTPAAPASSTDVGEIASALDRVAYLTGRARQHERLMALAGVELDRAAAALLQRIAESEPLRSGELAARMSVEASHITRQVQQMEKAGYVTRVPDPDDRRAQRVRLTAAGQEAVDRIREASRRGMQMALADWTPEELHQLATLFHRMVDDFVARAEEDVALSPRA